MDPMHSLGEIILPSTNRVPIVRAASIPWETTTTTTSSIRRQVHNQRPLELRGTQPLRIRRRRNTRKDSHTHEPVSSKWKMNAVASTTSMVTGSSAPCREAARRAHDLHPEGKRVSYHRPGRDATPFKNKNHPPSFGPFNQSNKFRPAGCVKVALIRAFYYISLHFATFRYILLH